MTLFVTTYLHKSKISVFAPQILETKVTIRGGVFFFFFSFPSTSISFDFGAPDSHFILILL